MDLREEVPEYSELKEYHALLRAGDYQNAATGYESFLKRHPESVLVEDAMYYSGYALMNLNRIDKAEKYFMELLNRFPGGKYAPDATLRLAIIAMGRGNYSEARQMLLPLLNNKNLDIARISYLIGEADYYLKDYFNSLLNFREAYVKFDSNGLKENVRMVVEELIIPQLTQEELKQCSNMFPKDFPGAECIINLANFALKAGNAVDAERYAGSLLYYFPEDKSAGEAEKIIEIIERHRRVKSRNIGLLIPVSGKNSNPGMNMLKGCLHAAGVFSESEKRDFTVVVADTDDSPFLTEQGLDDLTSIYNVVAVAGPILSSTAYAAATRAQVFGVPILLVAGDDKLNEVGDYVFNFGLTYQTEARGMAQYAVQELNLKRFAILYPESEPGITMMNAFWDEIEKYGGKVVGIENYKPGKKEFSGEIKKLVGIYYLDTREEERQQWLRENRGKPSRAWKPYSIIDFDAIYIPDSADIASIILLYLPYYDIITPIPLGVSAWNNAQLLRQARKEAEGSVFPDIFTINSEKPEVRYFVETYRMTFNEEPDRYSALGFDACNVIMKTVEEGARNREEVRAGLLKIRNYSGATGMFSFREDGGVERKLVILRIKNGKIEIIKDGVNQ